MNQESLFYEDELDALKEAVRALSGTKVVGPMLWPEKTPDAAARSLSDALNPNRSERLTLAQVMLIMRRAKEKGVHGPWAWISGEIGYQATPVEPVDDLTRLLDEAIRSGREAAAREKRIERLLTELKRPGDTHLKVA